MNGKFNIMPFDRGGASSNIKEHVMYAQEIFNASIGFGVTYDKHVSYNSALNSTIDICNAVKRSIDSSENMGCEINALLCAYHTIMFEEQLKNSFKLNAIMHKNEIFSEDLGVNFTLNYIKSKSKLFESVLNVDVELNRNKDSLLYGLLVLNGFFDVLKFNEKRMSLNITIPAGSTLVVDTGNHTVMLDGVNVVDLYSGDVPMPKLKPETLQVTIDTGSGVIQNAGMLYRGCFL